jgi:hypothetical protein
MFWGCFSHDHKGPCHVYMKENRLQTADLVRLIAEKNAELELKLRKEIAEQEAKNAAKWAVLGRKPLTPFTTQLHLLILCNGSFSSSHAIKESNFFKHRTELLMPQEDSSRWVVCLIYLQSSFDALHHPKENR